MKLAALDATPPRRVSERGLRRAAGGPRQGLRPRGLGDGVVESGRSRAGGDGEGPVRPRAPVGPVCSGRSPSRLPRRSSNVKLVRNLCVCVCEGGGWEAAARGPGGGKVEGLTASRPAPPLPHDAQPPASSLVGLPQRPVFVPAHQPVGERGAFSAIDFLLSIGNFFFSKTCFFFLLVSADPDLIISRAEVVLKPLNTSRC